MDNVLYDLMDWKSIEGIVFADESNPHYVLGPHVTEFGILIQTFIPKAKSVVVKVEKTGKEYPMELADEEGFYAVLIPGKRVFTYTYKIVYDNGVEEERHDPYAYASIIKPEDEKRFECGIHYTIYEKLGAHIVTINGVTGVFFAVWAPNAIKVSVVGDFNLWDGRRHLMRKREESGIFELFIPELPEGCIYKYEVKIKGEKNILKSDPYGFCSEIRPNTASVVADLEHYKWEDEKWLNNRKQTNMKKQPMSIYEVHLGSWRKPDIEGDTSYYNYRELAPMLAEYVKKMNYTHIELMPIMEHPLDASWGYQVTGYYAVTSRHGSPEDFMYFMDYMHQKQIGVILDWVPAHFPKDEFGLAQFDGTCLYEHLDPRQGEHPHWGTLIYNYGRPQVVNFLIANALFWVDKYHADGIRMDAVASMLYLDYGKNDGEWVANMYGSNENLEAIELLKQLHTAFKKRKDGALLIAEESTAWPMITGPLEDGGLGFDYKWNMGWMNDFLDYMKCDPLFRKGRHGELTFSTVYMYSEQFILVLSHDEVVHGKGSMLNKMPGTEEEKFANLRVAYGFMMTHPGKKLLFMGQEFAQKKEWDEKKQLDWELLEVEEHKQMQYYVQALNRFYEDYPALYELDHESDGFEWVSALDADHSLISFLRKTEDIEDTLLVVCNFTPVVYHDFKVGVPFKGKYKEIFNSDREEFGGDGNVNQRLKQSKEGEWEGKEHYIVVTVPPLGISVFTCKPVVDAKAKKTVSKKEDKKSAFETEEKTTAIKAEKIKKLPVKEGIEKEVEKKKVIPQKKKLEEKDTKKENKTENITIDNIENEQKIEKIQEIEKVQDIKETKDAEKEKEIEKTQDVEKVREIEETQAIKKVQDIEKESKEKNSTIEVDKKEVKKEKKEVEGIAKKEKKSEKAAGDKTKKAAPKKETKKTAPKKSKKETKTTEKNK